MRARLIYTICGCVCLVGIAQCGGAPSESSVEIDAPLAENSDWPMYRGDFAGTGHSPLTEITPENVSTLVQAWSYDLTREIVGPDDRGPNSQVTPIVVDGVMYVPAADRVVAMDPVTGEEIWRHRVEGVSPSRRGVSYWPGEGSLTPRIIFVTGTELRALEASTGESVGGFGDGGLVEIGVPYNSVPLVYRNVVVIGANTPRGTIGGIGNARAYDARTGEELWEFDSVAQPGQIGHDTWAGDSWQDRLGANAWPFYFTVDEERGLLYLPLASPIPGYYGGDREGANLYGNSVVAVHAETGEYVWHFQTIHHDLWDADPPAPPALFDIERNGQVVPALGVTTKSGYLYILNRETGEPIYDVEERSVAASDVPGEQTYPTQPIPSVTPPMARVTFDVSDLVTTEETSAEHVEACEALVSSLGELVNQGPFTPWVYREPGGAMRTTLNFPGGVGGPNWGGAAYAPESGYLFVMAMDVGALGWMVDADGDAPGPYRKETPSSANFEVSLNGTRLPCQKPPWGQLTAIDGATGDIVWRISLGVTDTLTTRARTGRPGRAGAIVTASNLLFIASTDDNRFRAIEATSGRELWVERLGGRRGNANPMTYQGSDGHQYVVITATDRILAYRLP